MPLPPATIALRQKIGFQQGSDPDGHWIETLRGAHPPYSIVSLLRIEVSISARPGCQELSPEPLP